MGTSNSNNGTRGSGTPLVPAWLNSDEAGFSPVGILSSPTGGAIPATQAPIQPNIVDQPAVAVADPERFTAARNNFSRFLSSGGNDRVSLGRAVSGYISRSSGGSRQAVRRMGASRAVGARLLGFLTDVKTNGVKEVLKSLKLEALAGQPIENIFTNLIEYICPPGGREDENSARESFIYTIADLVDSGITDLDNLTTDQIQTVFELYATHAIEHRLYNDIGINTILLPKDLNDIDNIQTQLHDFIQHAVADALTAAHAKLESLTPEQALGFVDGVYEQSFIILQSLANKEAESK